MRLYFPEFDNGNAKAVGVDGTSIIEIAIRINQK